MLKGEYFFDVRTYECGPDGLVTLPSICNYLQEAASLHAETLGFSKTNFQAEGRNISWVLSRLAVKMLRYPRWEERICVTTFPRGARRIVAWRDFEIRDGQGEIIGMASSEWMVIDLDTRRLAPVPESVLELAGPPSGSVLGAEPFTAKLRYPDDGAPAKGTFRALHNHIDLNGHVNNVHYAVWALEPLKGSRPGMLEIVFRSEVMEGDDVSVFVAAGEDGGMYHRLTNGEGRECVVAMTR